MRLIFALVLMFATLLATPLQAAVVKDLYWQTTLVPDRSKAALKQAAQQALLKVIVRVTGQPGLVSSEQLLGLQKRAQQLVYEYQYRDTAKTLDNIFGTDPETGEQIVQRLPAVELLLRFDQQLLDKSLRRMNLPLWSNNRPKVLLLMVAEGVVERRLVVRDELDNAQAALLGKAAERGLPVSLLGQESWLEQPLESMLLWQLSAAELLGIGKAHGADAVLVGRLSDLSDGLWAAQWQLAAGGQKVSFMSLAGELGQVYAEGIGQVVDEMAARYAIQQNQFSMPQDKGLRLEIGGIKLLDDYVAIGKYLDNLAPIKSATLISVKQDVLLYQIALSGTSEQLGQAIGLDHRLSKEATAVEGVLKYHWSKN